MFDDLRAVQELAREFGVVAFLAIALGGVAWQALHIARVALQRKVGRSIAPAGATAGASCPWSPDRTSEWGSLLHDVREMAGESNEFQRARDRGEFRCSWNSRDEVRDLLQVMDKLTTTVAALDGTVTRWNQEMHRAVIALERQR